MQNTRKCGYLVIAVVFSAVLHTGTLADAVAARNVRSRQYEVIPPSWVTADGRLDHGDSDNNDSSRAFIFPSQDPGGALPPSQSVSLPNFFRPNNRFHEKQFTWAPGSAVSDRIELHLTRNATDLTIYISPDSMARIRSLSWQRFVRLQCRFKDWLLDHSGCWLFGGRLSRFQPTFYQDLSGFWRDHVLSDASLKQFAEHSLNASKHRNFTVEYGPERGISMHATEVGEREVLSIMWGTTALYPDSGKLGRGISSGYSRMSVGGASQLQIYRQENGLSLFPTGAATTVPVPEDTRQETADNLLPFPASWSGLMAGEQPVFLPIYNPFDLHDARLLKQKTTPPPYIFLLTPVNYVKADAGPGPDNISQFSLDGRSKEASPLDSAKQLSRRCILIGCQENTPDRVQEQFIALINQARAIPPTDLKTAPAEVAYTAAVFANQTFVELRHHISVNGLPLETSVPDGVTWGTVVASWMFSILDSSSQQSRPILEVRRTVRNKNGPSETSYFLFYTTASAVLNQAQAFEGDEFYGRSDVRTLLR